MLFISALVNAMVCGTSIAIPKIMKARCGGENIPGGLWFIRLFYVTAVIHLVKLIGLFYPVAGVDVLGDFSFFLMSSIFLLATNADKGVIDLRSLLRGVEEKSRAQKVADSVDASCWIASLNGDCIAVNKKYMDTLQVSLEDCLGYGWVKMVAPGQDYISKWNNHIREASLASFESVFRGRAGKGIKTFRSSVRPWLDHDFSHLGYIGVLHEIKGEPDFVTHLRRATNGG